ncbi:MAG: citrate (Si)-synthase, partial [Opitutaceae bacterium]
MANDAVLKIEGKEFPLPTMVGSEGEKAVDVRNLRAQTGFITYDDGFGNTGSCTSGITF